MKVYEFLEKMDILAPFASQLEWDNAGLLVGNPNANINRIFVALDLTDEVISEAAKHKCELVLTHHPFIFRPVNRVVMDDVVGKRVIELIAAGISNVAMHTNFDVHVMGRIVSERLHLTHCEVLDPTEQGRVPAGIGTICDLVEPVELIELAGHVRDSFLLPFASYFGDGKDMVSRCAVVPGSGKSEIQMAIKKGADVLITGDISHHDGLDAVAAGLKIIDAGHYGIEHVFVEYMVNHIKNCFKDVEVYAEGIKFPRSLV